VGGCDGLEFIWDRVPQTTSFKFDRFLPHGIMLRIQHVLGQGSFPFTVQVKHKQYINSWLHFDMSVFYDWPFPHMYFAKDVARIIFPFNSWLSFQRLCLFLWGYTIVHRAQTMYTILYSHAPEKQLTVYVKFNLQYSKR